MAKFDTKAKDVDAVQWLVDKSNTVDILAQFFPHVMVYDAGNGLPKMVILSRYGVVTAVPSDWFVWDAAVPELLPEVMEDSRFQLTYGVK